MRPMLAAAIALCLAAAAPPRADHPLAPDGQRGLGAETKVGDLLSLLRSNRAEDERFLAQLFALKSDLRVLAGAVSARYRELGLYDALDRKAEPSLDALHARLAELEADPLAALAASGRAARAFARMEVDPRFHARARVLAAFEREARELSAGLAVLRGATDGFVVLNEEEAHAIAARADLAASWLRAAKNDLNALQPSDDRALDEAAAALVRSATSSEGEGVRRAAVASAIERSHAAADAISAQLFTVRLEAKSAQLFEWRARALDRAAPLRSEALEFLPDTPEGHAARDEVRALAKHERVRFALGRAREGLAHDPLDDTLAWATAHAADFLYGLEESRPFYDRFLALRGIRAHDHRTMQGRDLDEREKEALDAVQRAYLPGSRK
jgi:hypothetical protein